MEVQSFSRFRRLRPLSAVLCRLSSAWPLTSRVSRLPSSSRPLSAVRCRLSSPSPRHFHALAFAFFAAHSASAAISIVDFGFPAGTNRFGCASDPAVFERALAPLGEVRRLPAARLHETNVLCRATTDLLIVPCGSAFPAAAAPALRAYLKAGGSLLTTGGYAFDAPLVKADDGRWMTADDVRAALPPGVEPVPLLPASWWGPSVPEGYPARMQTVRGPDGSDGVEVRQDKFHFWVNAYMSEKGTNRFEGADVISFYGRGGGTTRRGKVEFVDRDGKTRWFARFPVTDEWREYRLAAADFRTVSTPKDPTKVPPFSFSRTRSFAIGVDLAGADQERPAAFAIACVRKATDARARSRVAFPRINTRYGRLKDAIHPRDDQVGAFDPSFTFADARLPGFDGTVSGYAAVAQLGVNGHGFSKCRCVWRELAQATSADGESLGPAAGLVYHFDSTFKGSAWALFGVADRDLFTAGSPWAGARLRALARRLLDRLHLNRTRARYACYRVGERAEISTRVANLGGAPRDVTVRMRLADETGNELRRFEQACTVKAGEQLRVAFGLPVTDETPDLVTFTAELVDARGARIDEESGAFVVWNEDVIAGGPKLTARGSLFALDGSVRFWTGAQTFWGQTDPYTARDPLAFARDFKRMREMGLRWTRQFIPWRTEWGEDLKKADVRFSDAVVQLAQKYGLVFYHTEYAAPNATGEALKEQNRLFAEIAARYRTVPGFAIDIRNEPYLSQPSSRAAMEQERTWLASNRRAAEAARPGVLVSVGHSQGWAGGRTTKDPAYGTQDLDFTDRHYYGDPNLMPLDLKDVDQRILGKPLVLGECGAKCHPTFQEEDAGGGDDEAMFATRFRVLAARTFGLGGAAILAWHWRDPMEGLFPHGLLHATGVPRRAGPVFARISRAFGRVELAENAPDVVVALDEERRADGARRGGYIRLAHELDKALLYWGANWSKVTASRIGDCRAKLVLKPEDFEGRGEDALRREIGDRLRAARCRIARHAGDSELLESYIVPCAQGTAWVFWNDGNAATTVSRPGFRFTLPPKRIGFVTEGLGKDPSVEIL